MSEAEKFLNNHADGYNSFEIQEMISLPKIKIQALMSEFAYEQMLPFNGTILNHEETLRFLKMILNSYKIINTNDDYRVIYHEIVSQAEILHNKLVKQ